MAVIEINRDPTPRELRWFGVLFAIFFAIVGVIAIWRFSAPRAAVGIWSVAGVIVLVYAVAPPVRRPLYLGWMYAAFPIGWTVSHTILALAYYLVFTPIGLIMRLVGRDPMERKFRPDQASYWVEHRPWGAASRYFKQF
jgi:hypothetical protein